MNHQNQRGTSLVEMLFVLAILGLLIGGITKFFQDSQKALIDTENRSDLAAISQNMDKNLRQSLLQSQRLLCDLSLQGQPSTLFDNHKTRVIAGITASASQAPVPVAWSVLPKVMTEANLNTSSAVASAMGNAVLFVAAIAPLRLTGIRETMPAGTPTPVATNYPLSDVTLDRFQIVYIYMSLNADKRIPGLPGALRLVEWRSKPYVSFAQLASMAAGSKRSETAERLVDLGYEYAFDIGSNDGAAAFYPITSVAPYFVSYTAANLASFPEHSWAYVEEFNNVIHPNPNPKKPLGRVSANVFSGGVSGFPSRYSVAYNTLSPTVNPGNKVDQLQGGMQGVLDLPVFANAATDTASAFPGGFEVGVFGSPNKREIWMRTVVMAHSGGRITSEKKFPAAEGTIDVTLQNPD